MKKIIISSALIAALSLFTGLQATASSAPSMDEVKQAISAAEAAIKKAASVDGEWRDSGKFLKQAKAAAEKGDNDLAMKLAKKAQYQGEMGFNQAMEQKNAGPWAF